MAKKETEAATKAVTISGVVVQAPILFEEGRVINAAEAAVLVQTMAENIGNRIRTEVKAVRDAEGPEAAEAFAQTKFDELVEGFEFSLVSRRGGRGPTLDPVEREAMVLAKSVLNTAIKEKAGVTIKAWIGDNGQEAYDEKIASLVKNPNIIEQAEKAVRERAAKKAEAASLVDL